jgi:hypothetical protein
MTHQTAPRFNNEAPGKTNAAAGCRSGCVCGAPADVEIGNLDALAAQYPAVAADLRAIAASAEHVAL